MSKFPERWVLLPRPRPAARLTLLCFPFAGGGTAAYREWPKALPPEVEVGLVQLPGRERRLQEAPMTSLTALVETLAEQLSPVLSERPFAFFGHSMGALICYELARHLQSEYGLAPAHLFLSAHRAPSVPRRTALIHHLPDDAFKARLLELNGTPAEVMEHEELMALLLPLFRADFTLCETYQPTAPVPLDLPISVFGGLSDPEMPEPDLAPWRDFTRGPFSLRMYPGDHFYLKAAQPELWQAILQDLKAAL